MIDERIRKMFGNTLHTKIFLFFCDNPSYITNIMGLMRKFETSYPMIREIIDKLVEIGILNEYYTGKSIVYKLNESSLLLAAFREFVNNLEREDGGIKEC